MDSSSGSDLSEDGEGEEEDGEGEEEEEGAEAGEGEEDWDSEALGEDATSCATTYTLMTLTLLYHNLCARPPLSVCLPCPP